MPPIVDGEVAPAPVLDGPGQELDAIELRTFHLEDVRQRMDRPDVPSIVPERGAGPVFGFGVLAVLLQSEGVHPLHETPARQIVWPRAQDSFDDPTQALLVSEEEIEILGHFEGEQIARIMEESPFEEVDGAFPFATGPGLRGQHMEELAFAGTEVPAVESHDELRRRLESGLGSRVQRQVGLQDASEDEFGVGRRRVSKSQGSPLKATRSSTARSSKATESRSDANTGLPHLSTTVRSTGASSRPPGSSHRGSVSPPGVQGDRAAPLLCQQHEGSPAVFVAVRDRGHDELVSFGGLLQLGKPTRHRLG